jgi:proteasome activator subunit 4
MAVDGPIRADTPSDHDSRLPAQHNGYLGGSKALDSLDRFITSVESFFHPSNFGAWSLNVGHYLVAFKC